MRQTKIVLIRDNLRGKTLCMFDILADGGQVDTGLLYETVSGRDRTSLREMRKYLGRYSARLNRALRETGQQVRQVHLIGNSTYILARRAGRGDAELLDRIARLETLVTGGIVPGSPTWHRARRLFATICTIPAQTVGGAVARSRLFDFAEFQSPLDQARLQRAAVRDAAVFW